MRILKLYLQPMWNARVLLIYSFLAGMAILIIAPFLMISLRSVGKGWFGKLWLPPELTLQWFESAITIGNIPEVMKNTFFVALIAVGISTMIGILSGWAFGRRHLPGREVLMSLILLPRMIPPITFALGVAKIFYGLDLVNTYLGVGLAHVSLCAPYAILVLSSTFEGLDERVLEASSVCGANALKSFFYVILPMILPGILASMIFTFTTSYNEFTLTLMTYGPDTVTMAVRTYLAIGEGYIEITSAMSVILVVPSLVILAMIQSGIQPEKLIGGFKGV
jgi:putative spermidine/putrescine transport system permease protein